MFAVPCGFVPNVRCRLCPVQPCPVQSSSALPASQPVCFFPYGVVFVCSFVLLIKAFFLQRLGLRLIHSLNPWQNEPTMKRTQRKKGLYQPSPASTLSSPLYEGILQFRALRCLRQQGTDVRTFAQRFSDTAEGLGFNHAALKDMFNSVLDEPLSWWRMRGLDHLPFWEFVGFLTRSPATEAGAPPVAVEEAVQELAVGQEAVPEPVPVQEPTEPAPVEAKEAAAPSAALDEAAAPPVVADGAPAPPVAAEEAVASRSQKRRRRRKKASSPLQGLEAVPELSAGQKAIPESPKLLAPPKRLALPAPLQRLALPAPPKRLALPAPPRLPVLPGPPWQPAKLLAPPWPPDRLEPAWSVPPAPPWPSSRVPVRPDPPWFVPPWPSSRVPVWPDPPWSVPPAPPWLPARIPGLREPPWLNPPVPPWSCWASLLALAWLPSLPPLFVSVFWLFLSGLLLCVSLCVVMFLCCHVSVLFLVSLIRDARWRPFWGGVVSGFCHFGLVLSMVLWQSPDTPILSAFSCERAASSVLESRAVSFACLVSCWSVVFGSRHSCLEFWSRDGVRTLALHFLSLCECAVSSSLGIAHSCPRGFSCVARSSCFYRLHAFMLYLVLCGTQLGCFHVVMSCVNTWLMSFLISCVFMSCFAHGWWFVCWPCACVSVLCEHVASVLVFCVPRALMSICLDPTHLVTCLLIHFPQLFSLVTLIICSL